MMIRPPLPSAESPVKEYQNANGNYRREGGTVTMSGTVAATARTLASGASSASIVFPEPFEGIPTVVLGTSDTTADLFTYPGCVFNLTTAGCDVRAHRTDGAGGGDLTIYWHAEYSA